MTTVADGQNIMDVSAQETGTIENMIAIALDDNLSLNDVLDAGNQLSVSDSLPVVKTVTDYYTTNEIVPATQNNFTPDPDHGLGFDNLEYPNNVLTIE